SWSLRMRVSPFKVTFITPDALPTSLLSMVKRMWFVSSHSQVELVICASLSTASTHLPSLRISIVWLLSFTFHLPMSAGSPPGEQEQSNRKPNAKIEAHFFDCPPFIAFQRLGRPM